MSVTHQVQVKPEIPIVSSAELLKETNGRIIAKPHKLAIDLSHKDHTIIVAQEPGASCALVTAHSQSLLKQIESQFTQTPTQLRYALVCCYQRPGLMTQRELLAQGIGVEATQIRCVSKRCVVDPAKNDLVLELLSGEEQWHGQSPSGTHFEMPRGLTQRILEPELMVLAEQVSAYANTSFRASEELYLSACLAHLDPKVKFRICDLGCGPGEICVALARALPHAKITAVDGSGPMLTEFEKLLSLNRTRDVKGRIHTLQNTIGLPGDLEALDSHVLKHGHFDAIVSSSLLHHLQEPISFWQTISTIGIPGTKVVVMDLIRPADDTKAAEIVELHAKDAPAVLKRDFYNSLRAAFRPNEVRAQLQLAGLDHFRIEVVSDRHMVITGSLLGCHG